MLRDHTLIPSVLRGFFLNYYLLINPSVLWGPSQESELSV